MKQYILFLLSILIVGDIGGQSQNNKISYNAAPSFGNYKNCEGFILKPGFAYKAAIGKAMAFKADPSVCIPELQDVKTSEGHNYIITVTPIDETTIAGFSNGKLTLDYGVRSNITIQYFDGLGRPEQRVQCKAAPDGISDLVTIQEYDAFGRESNSWLPGQTKSNGAYSDYAVVKTSARTINNGDQEPYSYPKYESSPLNRIIKQYGPGAAWHEKKAVEINYITNTSDLPCAQYTVVGNGLKTQLKKLGNYPTGQLNVIETKDEDGYSTYEFKNQLDQVLLRRQLEGSLTHDTYYVYDAFGNLCYVLPPLATDELKTNSTWADTHASLTNYAYQYKYNDRNLCISKKLPGCDWTHYVYDKADRLILSQDGEQRTSNKWSFTKYDDFGRIILTGIAVLKDKTHSSLQDTYKTVVVKEIPDSSQPFGYTWNTLSGITYPSVLTANYYDDIERMLSLSTDFKTKLAYSAKSDYGTKHTSDKGLLVGTRAKYTNETGNIIGEITTAMYYDIKGQLIQTQSTNHKGGTESEYIAYNFTGQPTKRQHVHKYPGKTDQTETYTYEYDHAGRLLATKHQLNTGSTVVLAQNTYDDLGRLKSTVANNQSALSTSYTYNVRSWTKSISNPLFSQTLYYNDAVKSHSYSDYQTSYTGNISGEEWSIQGEAKRSHRFKYDGLSRLTHSAYNGVVSGGTYNTSYSYDKHGNVLTLVRNSGTKGMIDNLTFKYDGTGNQVKFITDAYTGTLPSTSADFKQDKSNTSPYAYNKNGAMTYDPNKGLSIKYNSLNLPQEMAINNVSARGKNFYTYTATGTKLQVKHWSDPTLQAAPIIGTSKEADYRNRNTTDYIGNKIYENGVLNKTLIDNGYIEGNNYYFYVRDHLGNNRIVASATGSVIQRNNYYPFGMSFGEESGEEQGKQNFKYNGKELDKEHGLNQYDYAARFMDPSMVRFTTVDPHAENYFSWSPYAYVGNNPIRRIDPNGKDWGDFFFGVIDAVKSNSTMGATDAGGITLQGSVDNPSHYNSGRAAGDVISIVQGFAQIVIGGGAAGGGAAATALSGGTTSLISIPAVIEGAGFAIHGATVIGNALKKEGRMSEMSSGDNNGGARSAKDPLRRDSKSQEPLPDPEAKGSSHTQLGTKSGRKGDYKQAREFDSNNKPVRDIDFTDHGRPANHPNPHQHKYKDNPTGGTRKRNKNAEPLD